MPENKSLTPKETGSLFNLITRLMSAGSGTSHRYALLQRDDAYTIAVNIFVLILEVFLVLWMSSSA